VRWWREGRGEGRWWGVDCGGAEGGHVGFGIDGRGLVGMVIVLVNCAVEAGAQCGLVACRLVLWRCHRRRLFDSRGDW
jgi:hypothetical protein